jgi:Mn-dependent DtxR family transcriptional regulator
VLAVLADGRMIETATVGREGAVGVSRDRVESDQFPMTQEFLAMMLGASRPTVTVVAGTLQKAGLIKYHRGQITIVDGEALEDASCECYRTATELLNVVTDRTSLRIASR